ncbi:acetyl-CoA synthetase-like protein [Myriangium duriaei CBS 260.36]|uniref:Acetyl-CoA synthetase-like protein n=1 Tax=Myriangium duriaei CBS 260.36 TaxID=1168546 RepID=A0A9P4MJC2_9PEZI|nr:acetyl-CoA synthetase-like protein [Myriangium duriaei CBS 260.36]
MAPQHPQDATYEASISSPDTFWVKPAEQLTWTRSPRTIFRKSTKKLASGVSHPHWQWFPDGELSTTYNCIDRHVEAGHGSRTAIIWDSPVSGSKEKLSYAQLREEVATLAGVLREEGVKRGDVVLVYMPMIPAALIGILAVAQLGAIHAVVFGGFSGASLAQRIEASKPVAVLTASCGIEGAKGPLSYKPMVQEAISLSSHKPSRTLIWQRDQLRWDPVAKENGERNWQRLVKSARNRGLRAVPVSVGSNEGLYIIYTSGTTGTPKGVVREVGGHAVQLNFSMRYLFGIRPGDVMFCASDIGWVVGHSYILYAPLLAGATTVLFEGKPVGTPNADSFWRILEEHKVNCMFTAPTALRAIKRDDSKNEFLSKRGQRDGLRSLRALFLAGERSEPSIVSMYQDLLEKYGAPGASVVDNWWSSESGSPISGIAQLPATGLKWDSTERSRPLGIKAGSAGKPMPGFDVRIVDDDGKEVKQGEMGNIVLGIPLAPTGLTTLWKDEERFYKGYLRRFDGKWIDTGDAGMVDEDGYVHIMARSDDIINVAAHRLSTGAIEQAISSHAQITEACVVPIPDSLKGHMPFAFAASSSATDSLSPPGLLDELNQSIRKQIGPIATLGGIIVAPGVIPKTRSGKTLRRVLRQLLEQGAAGEFDKEVSVPATVEDAAVVDNARKVIRQYFEKERSRLKAKL